MTAAVQPNVIVWGGNGQLLPPRFPGMAAGYSRVRTLWMSEAEPQLRSADDLRRSAQMAAAQAGDRVAYEALLRECVPADQSRCAAAGRGHGLCRRCRAGCAADHPSCAPNLRSEPLVHRMAAHHRRAPRHRSVAPGRAAAGARGPFAARFRILCGRARSAGRYRPCRRRSCATRRWRACPSGNAKRCRFWYWKSNRCPKRRSPPAAAKGR